MNISNDINNDSDDSNKYNNKGFNLIAATKILQL